MTTAARRIEVVHKGRHYQIAETKELLPSVTNILGATPKPALVRWAANTERELVIEAAANLYEDAPIDIKMSRPAYIATLQQRLTKQRAWQKELQKAADIGTQAHALIEWNLRRELLQKVGPEPLVDEKALWAFMAWEDWRNKTNLAPLAIEQTIWSLDYGYAGTMDLFAELDIDGKRQRAVIDWKTGKAIYGEALLQSAAYVEAMVEMGHAERDNTYGLIVRLPKAETDPEFETRLVTPDEQADLLKVFQHVKAVWAWQKKEDDKYWQGRK